MQSNFDHYAAAKCLAEELESRGLGEWASKIRSVMAEGSTGTEIFMGLKWHLCQMKAELTSLPQELWDQLAELLAELDKALR